MIKKANKKNLFDGKQAIIRLTENQLYFKFSSFTQSLRSPPIRLLATAKGGLFLLIYE
jgi:hypothetical protein